MRDDDGCSHSRPGCRSRIDRLAFSLRWRGHRLRVTLARAEARYELPDAGADAEVELWHHGESLRVTGAEPVTRPMPSVPDPGPEPPSPPGRRPTRRSTD